MTNKKNFVRKRRYSKEEFARMGDEIYENKVRPLVEEENKGKIVAIDIETGDYRVEKDGLKAAHYLIISSTRTLTRKYGA